MKRTIIFMAILCLVSKIARTQSQEGLLFCETIEPETPTSYAPEELNQCFTVSEVQSNCAKVWIRVNFHFFVDSNCEGTIDPICGDDIPIEDAYQLAEELINSYNTALEENYVQWQQIPFWGINEAKPAQCVPFRYALSGVYVHCDGSVQGSESFNFFQTNFGVNISTEYNAYFVDHGSGCGNGIANGIPGNAFKCGGFHTGLFNHEMGHILNLRHSWDEDFIDDTPPIHYMYDYNCDGDFLDNFPSPGVGSEAKKRQCWSYFNPNNPSPGMDYDGDGVIDYQDLCDIIEDPNCALYPCCDWKYINNNIMAYTNYNICCAAYTEGQITRILQNLSTATYCDYIEEITDDICLPPMSNIHILPNESVEEDCSYCFQIAASMHDPYYQLDFYTPSGALHYTTGLRNGPATGFCISRSIKYADEYRHGFIAGVEYTAVLTVENDCGDEASESIDFTLPTLPSHGCQAVPNPQYPVTLNGLYPNPFSNEINIEYTVEATGNLSFWLVPYSSNGSEVLLGTEHIISIGTSTKTINTQYILPGMYYLVIDLNGYIDGDIIQKF